MGVDGRRNVWVTEGEVTGRTVFVGALGGLFGASRNI